MREIPVLPLKEIILQSQIENECFRRHQCDEHACSYELFRRAVVENNQEAWEAIYQQYWRLVAAWVHLPGRPVEDEVNDAFLKFFHGAKAEPFTAKFQDFTSLMGYFKTTAYHVKMDVIRKMQSRAEVNAEDRSSIDQVPENRADPFQTPVPRIIESRERYRQLLKRMKDDKECLILKLTIVRKKPVDIYAEYADIFESVEEVYRIKERIFKRLAAEQAVDRD